MHIKIAVGVAKLLRLTEWVYQRPLSSILLLILSTSSLICYCPYVSAQDLSSLQQVVAKTKGVVAIVSDLDSGKVLLDSGSQSLIKPASVLKLVTTGAALHTLGPLYSFKTEVYATGWNPAKNFAETIILHGGGDPSLNLESLWILARKIRKFGLVDIGQIVLDESLYAKAPKPKGQRAYQAGSSPLAFNFNSVGIEICPSKTPGLPAIVKSEPLEYQAVISGGATTAINGLGVDVQQIDDKRYRVSGKVAPTGKCEVRFRSVKDTAKLLGETLVGMLRSLGVVVKSGYRVTTSKKVKSQLLFAHESPPLRDILSGLNHFSNNFTAEQIVYAIGANSAHNWSRELGLERMGRYLNDLGIKGSEFNLVDGSGLSHANRISARALHAVLRDLYKDPLYSTEIMALLPIAGLSGTLKTRNIGDKNNIVRAKTGSLDGVSSIAGYLLTRSGRRVAFVVVSNRAVSRQAAHRFEEDFLRRVIAGVST